MNGTQRWREDDVRTRANAPARAIPQVVPTALDPEEGVNLRSVVAREKRTIHSFESEGIPESVRPHIRRSVICRPRQMGCRATLARDGHPQNLSQQNVGALGGRRIPTVTNTHEHFPVDDLTRPDLVRHTRPEGSEDPVECNRPSRPKADSLLAWS